MSRCKGCGAEITWLKTPAGKYLPGDSYGTFDYQSGGSVITRKGLLVTCAKIKGVMMAYRPHWASCPNAKDFRKEALKDAATKSASES